MLEETESNDVEVEHRESALAVQHPVYMGTVQVVRDIDAERRLGLFQVYRIMRSMLVFLEILLAIRFILRLIVANPNSGFAVLIYGITGVFTAPFNGLIGTPTFVGLTFEITSLIAMAVYALIFWGIAYEIRMISDIPDSRSF